MVITSMTPRTAIVCCAFLLHTSGANTQSSCTRRCPARDEERAAARRRRNHPRRHAASRRDGQPRTRGRRQSSTINASYVLHLQTAEMSMDMTSLQNLMNRHVFAYQGSPLKDVTVEPDGPRLKMKGKLHKGIDHSVLDDGQRVDDGRWADAAACRVDEGDRRAHEGTARSVRSEAGRCPGHQETARRRCAGQRHRAFGRARSCRRPKSWAG